MAEMTIREQLPGQMDIFDFIPDPNDKVYPLEIRGIMDDPYCPKCGRGFWTEKFRSEVDCDRCPDCGIRLDWTPWHRLNDEEEQNGQIQ